MTGANLDGCDVRETVFDFADLSGTSLVGLKHVKSASFRGTMLVGANLQQAYPEWNNLQQARERQVRIEKAWEVPVFRRGGSEENAMVAVKVSGRTYDIELHVLGKYPDCVLKKCLNKRKGGKPRIQLPFRNQWAFETCLEWMMT